MNPYIIFGIIRLIRHGIGGGIVSFWDEIKKSYEEGKEKGKNLGSFQYQAQKYEEKKAFKKEQKQESKDRVNQMKKEGIAHCPKCKSTSIQYVERRKRLSIGRGIVGGAIAGPLGGAVGSITSKKYKGFIKCLNCGHQWKV